MKRNQKYLSIEHPVVSIVVPVINVQGHIFHVNFAILKSTNELQKK